MSGFGLVGLLWLVAAVGVLVGYLIGRGLPREDDVE